jgi:hypothetical protein
VGGGGGGGRSLYRKFFGHAVYICVHVKIIGNILHIMKLEPKKGGDDFALF